MKTGLRAALAAGAMVLLPQVAAAQDAHVAAAVKVEPDGLAIFQVEEGTDKVIAFGSDRPFAVASVMEVLGEAESIETSTDCGPGPIDQIAWKNGLVLNFVDGAFVGWHAIGDGISSNSGLTVGMKRADLLKLVPGLKIQNTKFGKEFTIGEVSGRLNDKDRVHDLEAGVQCVYG
ncbi:hypothetical protein ACFQ1E_11345 [Sphingomonas canadensis]|uniref:Uncharacterized protein n=1 Tax=Sphingomonas canadensis TaxID=1219257 RepID=A0ABW3H919_9SPHN|nr:hypothetical protein [Sphingomonas canadensis]MCW3836284.1 hypothetical protein [Sphingomonas canadensis]